MSRICTWKNAGVPEGKVALVKFTPVNRPAVAPKEVVVSNERLLDDVPPYRSATSVIPAGMFPELTAVPARVAAAEPSVA